MLSLGPAFGQTRATANVLLGIAFRDVNFKDVKGKLYPTVGLKKPGDHVWVNFGQLPFQFDIDGYMKVCRSYSIVLVMNVVLGCRLKISPSPLPPVINLS